MGKRIAVGILALLLTGGAGGYLVSTGQGGTPPEPQTEAASVLPTFVAIDPITLPVLRGDRVRRMVAFRIILELAPGKTKEPFRELMPRVEDAFVTELAALLALDWPGGQAIDLEIAKTRLMEESDRVIGEGVVARILFEHVQVRAL